MALFQHSSTFYCSLLPGKPPATHPMPLPKQPPHPFPLLSEMSRSVRQPGKYNLSVLCQHPSAVQEKLDVVRRQADFHPAVWDSHFLESKAGSQETNKQRIRELKEEVKSMLIQTNDQLQQMILIDTIDNLGVAYHFDEEIQAILQKIYSNGDDGDDFHGVTLRFKLLRQHGYHVSSDVFEKFKEKEGNFNQNLRNDAKGLLSLYEALQYRLPGEDILDEAITFTVEQLKSISPQLHPALARHVQHSLSLPLQRSMLRLQARTYITFYEEDTTRNNVLLELAKFDFNHIQALHQDEIKELIRWWKDLELVEKVPFARDRLVESFMWGMDESYLPKFSLGRITLGKHVTMLPLIDEMYDMYGTLEELELLNDAIDRWDLGAMDQLPEYMKPFYLALYNLVHETDYISHENRDIGVDYLKKTWANYSKGMLQDARWSSSGYIPSVKEYLSVKQITTFGFGIFLIAALGMGDMVTKENLSYIVREPKLRIISNEISRLFNDLATSEVEEERGTINSVRCYMKEHGVSKEEARLGIKRLIGEKWKELHQEALKPIPLPKELVKACINFGRVNETFYQDGQDGYSDSLNWMTDHINTMLVEPIPM